MPGTQQIIWGSDKLFVVNHPAQWKIDQALEMVAQAMANTLPYTYNPTHLRSRQQQEGFLSPEVYKLRRKNHETLRKHLELLQKHGYIQHFTLTSHSPMKVVWLKEYHAPEVPIIPGKAATEIEEPINPNAKLRPRKTDRKMHLNDRQWPKYNKDYPEFTGGNSYHNQMKGHIYGSIKDKDND